MSQPMIPGEPVTLVLPDHIVQVEVAVSTKQGFTCTLTTRGGKTLDSPWKLTEEGTGWVRGYHSADSDVVKACRASQALASKPEPPTTMNEILTASVAGEMERAPQAARAQLPSLPPSGVFPGLKK